MSDPADDEKQAADRSRADFAHLLAYCQSDGRICPAPLAWQRLWKLLPDKERVGGGWRPGLPLILAGWWASNDRQKRAVFIEHILWAREHGVWDAVEEYLLKLRQEEWHCEAKDKSGRGSL